MMQKEVSVAKGGKFGRRELKARSLKIHPHYYMPPYDPFTRKLPRIVPKIFLCGNWLEEAGFKTGQRIKVTCSNKQLVITPE